MGSDVPGKYLSEKFIVVRLKESPDPALLYSGTATGCLHFSFAEVRGFLVRSLIRLSVVSSRKFLTTASADDVINNAAYPMFSVFFAISRSTMTSPLASDPSLP